MTAIALDERLLIRASAGTGKTYALTSRIISRLHSGVDPSAMLAVTFTRNAAAEILNRVLVRLARAATDAEELGKLAAAIGVPKLDPARCQELLGQLVDHLQHIRVSTLDSYFAQVATSFCLELGLPPAWQMLDRNAVVAMKRRAIDRLIGRGDQAVLRRLVNLLAGTDTSRSIADVLAGVVGPMNDVYLDTAAEAWTWITPPPRLTDAQRDELLTRFEAAPIPDDQRWQTAHLKSLEAARRRNWTAFAKAGVAASMAKGKDDYRGVVISNEVREAYEEVLAVASADVVNILADQTAATRDLLELFDAEYKALKGDERCLEFSDVTRTLAGSSHDSTPDQLAHRLNGSVDHLLFDEFQDTSSLQWRVLEPLAREVTGEHPGRSFFCVGDEKQAIYGWRGGVASIFGTLEDQLQLVPDNLVKSYRSSPVIIETLNDVFRRLDRHGDLGVLAGCVHDWSARFPKHKPHFKDRPGYSCLRSVAGSRGAADPDAVADEIARIATEAAGWEVGVLVRRNKVVADLVARLRQRGVRASEEGGFVLTDSAPVRTLLALVRLADHPGDSIAAFQVAHSPLGPVVELAEGASRPDVLVVSRRLRGELFEHGYGPSVGRWARAIAPAADPRERFRLSQFIRLAYRFDRQSTLRPIDFDRFIRLERFGDPTTDRVRVMTIHKAKGLEFDIVVLPELDDSLTGRTDVLVTRRPDPSRPPDRVCRTTDKYLRQLLPPEIEDVFLDDDLRETTESLCELYVAMTRARYALHMIIPPSTKTEKKLPASPAGLLRAALTDRNPVGSDKMLWESGEPRWFDDAERDDEVEAEERSLDIKLEPLDGPRRRGRRRLTPSGLEGGSELAVDSLFRPRSSEALDHGTLVHAWFEQFEWLDDLPTDERLAEVAVERGLTLDDLDKRLVGFHQHLDHPEVRALFVPDTYASPERLPFEQSVRDRVEAGEVEFEVNNEYPFVVDEDGAVLRGTIDRLVLLTRGDEVLAADTIDFKTDRVVDDEAIAERIEHYRAQLDAYRRAVGRLFGLASDRIATRLVFLEPGLVVSVD